MGASVSDEAIKRHKELSIRRIDGLLDSYIVTGDTKHMKKADLISYWLEEFSKYISQEESFDPGRLIRYSRGDVIRVNFGFRVGSEFGGLHFAVVVEKGNARSSKVVTVVPLSSTDGRTIRPENVDLGQELYTKAIAQQNVLLLKAQKELGETKQMLKLINSLSETASNSEMANESDYRKLKESIIFKQKNIDKLLKRFSKNVEEISRMKSGSMAIINQITTISKQRIYTPKKAEDFLYNVSLSDTALNKINEKLKEKYIF